MTKPVLKAYLGSELSPPVRFEYVEGQAYPIRWQAQGLSEDGGIPSSCLSGSLPLAQIYRGVFE